MITKKEKEKFLIFIATAHPFELEYFLSITKNLWKRKMIKKQIKIDLEDYKNLE